MKTKKILSTILSKLASKRVANFSLTSLVISLFVFIFGSYTGAISTSLGKFVMLIVLILTVTALILFIISYSLMMKSLRNIINSAKKVSQGQLNISDIIVWGEGDLKTLAKGFNFMKANILAFINQTQDSIIVLTNSIDRICEGINNTFLGNEQIANTMLAIAAKSEEQLKIASKASSEIAEVDRSVEHLTLGIKDVENNASMTTKKSAEGKERLGVFGGYMEVMSGSIEDTNEFITNLKVSALEIENVIEFISNLSEQLKLLSLNASIEAARSGEAGKGFAVVANEITKLSENTKEGIGKINNIVESILLTSDYLEGSIQKSINNFNEGAQIFSDVQTSFNNIYEMNSKVLSQLGGMVNQILDIRSSTQNTAGLSQRLYDSSVQVTRETEEVAAVIQEEHAELIEINTSMESLQLLLKHIEKIISQNGVDVKIIDEKPRKQLKIAAISLGFSEFWTKIDSGILYAKKKLEERNVIVDLIGVTLDQVNPKSLTSIFNKCISDGYDGIATIAFFEELSPFIDVADKKGIPVMTINSEYKSIKKRLALVGQNSYDAGIVAARTMLKLIEGRGKILIVKDVNDIEAFMVRKKGFEDTLAQNNRLKVVDVIVSPNDTEKAYTLFKSYISQHKDIDGVFVIATGQVEIARAVEDHGLSGKIKIIVFDATENVMEYIKKGTISCAIGQDPFRQGYDPIIHLYNYLVKGIKPESEYMWTRIELFDQESVKNLISS